MTVQRIGIMLACLLVQPTAPFADVGGIGKVAPASADPVVTAGKRAVATGYGGMASRGSRTG